MSDNITIELENVSCSICNKSNFSILSSHYLSNLVFNIVKCKCDFIYLNPRPSEESISNYYDNSYSPHNTSRFSKFTKILQKLTFYWKKCTIMKYIKSPGNILDWGAGDGAFGSYMKLKGWCPVSYDKFSNYDKKINYIESEYNVVTMWHSLEHVHNIKKTLTNIKSVMTNQSYLFIAVPNYNSIDRIIFKDRWIALDVPRHLYHFTPNTMKDCLEKNGFKIIDSCPLYQDLFFNLYLSLHNIVFKILLFPVLLLFLLPLIILNNKYSSSILYICQKK